MWKFFCLVLFSIALASAADSNLESTSGNVSPSGLSESRVRILLEMTKEVLKLKSYALKAAFQEASNINQYRKGIKSIVNVSVQNINEQLDDLEAIVKNATKEAKNHKKSISSCVRKEKWSKWLKIRSGRILQCKKTFSFEVLKLKLAKLAYVKVKAASVIPTCLLLHPISNKNLKNCIQNQIDQTYSTANQIKSEIDDNAANIYDEANNCIEDNLGNLDLDIEQISDDFAECVKNKLKGN
ncbi:uncharacterized protein LOC123309249 [Coccinella septempunctata]|uniref:uncharacterized protein LOC123309249 n=1 Tax=Coccinella septempunctata TaxID=41139 RepID=UPI001D08DBD8|nr:uncharacterized protein LOC123309249 [Coccinella septempunctata]